VTGVEGRPAGARRRPGGARQWSSGRVSGGGGRGAQPIRGAPAAGAARDAALPRPAPGGIRQDSGATRRDAPSSVGGGVPCGLGHCTAFPPRGRGPSWPGGWPGWPSRPAGTRGARAGLIGGRSNVRPGCPPWRAMAGDRAPREHGEPRVRVGEPASPTQAPLHLKPALHARDASILQPLVRPPVTGTVDLGGVNGGCNDGAWG
jgi:hypothetical protein